MKINFSRLFGFMNYKRLFIFLTITLIVIGGVFTGFKLRNSKSSNNSGNREVAGVNTNENDTPIETLASNPTQSPSPSSTKKPSSTPTPSPTPNNLSATTSPTSAASTPTSTVAPTSVPTTSTTPTASTSPSPAPGSSAEISIKVLNIFFIPYGISPIYNPNTLTSSLVEGIKQSSHNKLNYQIVETKEEQRSTTKNTSGRMDYNALLSEFNVCQRISSGQIDEVWIWVNGADGAGFEYTASGPTMNDPYSGMNKCEKNMFVMGFDYTRTWDLALHSMSHRMEFAVKNNHYAEYISWDGRNHRYSSPYNTQIPLENGVVGCGNVHFPPNATSHYDYTNSTNVQSSCTGNTQTINCSTWSCSQEGFLKWWLSFIPENWWNSFVGR